MAEAYDQWKFVPGAGQFNKAVGADIASAATIAPSALIHIVTGTTAVVNITPPDPSFCGIVILIWTSGGASWTAAGNIAVAGVPGANKATIFAYNPNTAKWYPIYLTAAA